MLVWVRKLLKNWVARGLFVLLVAVFVFWGISNVFSLAGSSNSVATVGGKPVDVSLVQDAYQSLLNQAEAQGQPDLATRQQLATQALEQVLRQQVLAQAQTQLGVAVPDSAVRQVIDSIPAFQTNGTFDKTKFEQVLQQNNSSPDKFVSDVKDELGGRQLVVPVVNGAAPSSVLLNQLFSLVAEQRTGEVVTIPSAAQPAPAAPSDAVLQRYWKNHPQEFTAPEYRQIKLVILSPALLAPHEVIPQAAIDAAIARARAASPTVAQRSVQVLSVQDLADSSLLEAAWKKGASWDEIQAMAKNHNANAVVLTNASQSQIPAVNLAQAVFAAQPGKVVGPIAGTMGMYVFKVTNVTQNGPDPATLAAQVTQQLQLQKAQADVAQNVDAVQDALAGQTPLDQLPGNLGLTALEGTLDANGNAQDGTPAPIPGGADLKKAIVQAAFAGHPGDSPQLTNGPDGSYFALTVDKILPPALQPFDLARAKVLAAWTADEQSRAAEAKAAELLQAVNAGKSLDDAASAAGYSVTMTPPVTRESQNSDGTADPMVALLFSLKQGQATMQQVGNGFAVVALLQDVRPTPAQDPNDYAQLQQAMTKSLQDDLGGSFLAGLQAREKVTVNQKLFAQIYQ